MSKEDLVEYEGIVTDVLAGSNFRVAIMDDNGNVSRKEDGTPVHTALCYLGGKIRQNSIKIILNDQVRIAVSPYDPSRGKIIYRTK